MLQEILTMPLSLILSTTFIQKKCLLPSSIIEWNNLDTNIRNSERFGIFKMIHCLKSVRSRIYSGSHFSCSFPHSDSIRRDTGISPYSAKMRENAGKMWTRITPNTDIFDTDNFKLTGPKPNRFFN